MKAVEAIQRMVAPGDKRPGKWRQGVIQIWLTRACDKACYGCTQGSNLRGNPGMITVEQFEQACLSLKDYWGVVGIFGGNPALHPDFEQLCDILAKYVPYVQRGLWCNNPVGKGKKMAQIFNPAVSNLNVHLDHKAYNEFRSDWPTSMPFGLDKDSRHSPPYVALKDVVPDEEERWSLIADCDINKHWSAMIGSFRGEARAWFCEIAGAQAMLHQHEPDYPDTGLRVDSLYDDGTKWWWQLPMHSFSRQVHKHCHDCGVPLRGYGALAQGDSNQVEQVSQTHAGVYLPKVKGREVQLVQLRSELGAPLGRMTDYIGNAKK